ncbi:hypothetical protein FCR2A7T_26800 [Flavobacterium cauense R2A-7]|uniref:WD40 repeat protein n=1 Tax=Flavobacterium cauense R2A-7 TaxID=1341154 RepID=V6RXP0_9FLAO|nr:hypothetical protein [Flavobacterium cauense]ESU19256.1 hypothetical protein FCR2A7T_26800 [Flavobacterium cauense R2A-7]KGO82126.1 hypothetical protein Q762_05375 [Flavobacterium cauense R2A-7]TWI15076.1 hypothetical protein IP98_00060 [Flavobacterium cauense R2A-7]
MKTKILLAATLLLSLQMQAQQLEKPKQIPIKGSFTNPVVSPDGNYVLLTKEHLKGVYLLNLKNKKITQISDKDGSGYAYSWNPNSTSFYYKEKGEKEYFSNSKVKSYSLKTKKAKTLNEINHNSLPSFKGKEQTKIVVYTNPATLKIEAKDVKTQKSWNITNEDGQFYNAILSHDGKKVAVHNGADIYVYPIEGNGKGIKIGTGIATAWSKDNKYLIGFLDESKDGHSVTNSDLYLFNAATAKSVKLTATANVIEMFPCFYDDNKIMFTDDKTGKIFTSQLKL